MNRLTSYALGIAAPLSLLSQAALADLTPVEVWDDWKSYMNDMGYQVEANESTSGGNLTVSDLKFNFALPNDEGEMSMSVGTIGFSQNSDGTVAVVLPDSMPITIAGKEAGEGGEEFAVQLTYSQTDHALTASGSLEAMTYLYTAGTFAVDVQNALVGDETLSPEDVRVNLSGTNASSTTTMTVGEMRGYTQSASVDNIAYDFLVDVAEEQIKYQMSGNLAGFTMNGTGAVPIGLPDASDMAAMMAAGFDVSGTMAFGSGTSSTNMQDPNSGNFTMESSSQGGALEVKMGADGLAYGGNQNQLSATVTVEGMPFPFQINMSEAAFNLAMPTTKSDDPQDFAFGFTMGNFTMSDMIWSMFDPAGQLPRDPATIQLDLAGKAKLLVDWLNPEEAAQMSEPPGELQSLTLNNLLVDAVGAKVEGNGDVSFDGAGPALVPGLGNPVGDVNVGISGANGLMDKLVAMGLLPQEQAMGARMMMGLFAVAGDGPDTLKSKIEFTADGQILANGQRLR